jgi:hypothetical protein
MQEAFEQIAVALAGVITDPSCVEAREEVIVQREAPNSEVLLVDRLNALIYEMAVRRLILARFAVTVEGNHLYGTAWGESGSEWPLDSPMHCRCLRSYGNNSAEPRVGFSVANRATGKMRVPGVLYASEDLTHEMDMKVFEQTVNVATLPGIQQPPIPCRMHIGVTASQSVGLRRLILRKAA